MGARRCIASLLAAGLAASTVTVSAPAQAAFPGANGLIAFAREAPAGDHTQVDVYTIRPNGTALRALTSTPDLNEFGPAWNAAGTRLAFWRTAAPFGPGAIWTMDRNGRGQRQLTRGFDARDPAWNPAGTRIVFTRVDTTGFHLWTMRASDGGDLRRLTSGPALDFEPAWSPDGTAIAFTRGSAEGDPGDIFVFDTRTRAIRRVTGSPEYDHQVNWAPGGGNLVFERDLPTSSSIFRVNPNGTGLIRLTTGAFFDVGPAYSPNGRLIAFGSDRGGAFFGDLWVMRVNGTGLRRVRALEFSESFPDWQPVSPS